MMLSEDIFDKLKWDIYNFGADKYNFIVKYKRNFIDSFVKKYPEYKDVPYIELRQIVTFIRTKVWSNISNVDKHGNIIESPMWTPKDNKTEIEETIRSLNFESLQIRTNVREFKRFHDLLMVNAPEGYEPYYFLLEPNGKDPLEDVSWKPGDIFKGTGKTFEEACRHLERGFNIGIAGTDKDYLSITDADDPEKVGKVKETLMVISRKQYGRHYFYFTKDTIVNDNIEEDLLNNYQSAKQNLPTDAGEVRAVWQYVVASGSFVECSEEIISRMSEDEKPYAGLYRVGNEIGASTITYEELPEVYKKKAESKHLSAKLRQLNKKAKEYHNKIDAGSNRSKLWELDIHDVTGLPNKPGIRFSMFTDFHDSDTEKNASIAEDILTCWRHNVSHNGLTYLVVAAGVLPCEDAGYQQGSKYTSSDFQDPYTVFTIWKYAKDNGHIPSDDPMPSQGMIYYALKNGFCEKKDIAEGWKLPQKAYNQVIDDCLKNGIDPGRGKIERRGRPRKEKNEDTSDDFKLTFDSIGERIMKMLHIFTMRDTKQIYIYENGVYITDGAETKLDTIIRDEFRNSFLEQWYDKFPDKEPDKIPAAKASYVAEVIAYIKAYTYTSREEIERVQYDYINFSNGLFNLKTWELEAHTHTYLSIRQIPVEYDRKAVCPHVNKFIMDVVSIEDATFLMEWAGYCLTPDCSQQLATMLYGQGRNGKSVFLALLQALVGKVNTSAESLQRIEFDKYRSAKLYGKLVNICGDIPDTKMHKSEVFKKLTSGLDDIDGENKYQDSFTFKNTAKLIFSANILPEGKKDKAYYRRWRLVEFPHEFAGDNEDKLIIEKLTCKTELSGLLNLALGGLKRLLKNGRFSYDKSVEDTEKTYMLNSNPVAFFMDQFTEVGGDDCEANDLFYAYLGWCEREHKKVVSNIEFSRRLSKMGYSSHRDNVPLGERTYKKVTMWDNLTIKYDELDRISSKNDEISCPNCINSTDTVKTDVGQDRQDLPLPRLEMENNKIKSNNENEENRTVEESKKGVFSNCLENSVTIKDSSCPKVRKCDSERQRTGCVDKIEKDPVQQEEITDFLENKEDYSGENLSFCESLRRDLKNFARSHYNFIVEDIFEFVREFNKKYPGYMNKMGIDAVMGNAERLKMNGWK